MTKKTPKPKSPRLKRKALAALAFEVEEAVCRLEAEVQRAHKRISEIEAVGSSKLAPTIAALSLKVQAMAALVRSREPPLKVSAEQGPPERRLRKAPQ